MTRHRILLRQLKRCNLTELECPATLEQWQKFLDRVNRAYADLDQDRYLSERSQQIFSGEMQNLNNELHEAESIAHLGRWSHDLKTGKIDASDETNRIFGLSFSEKLHQFEEFLPYVYPDDRQRLQDLNKTAMEQGLNFETDIRIRVADHIRWLHVIAKPIKNKEDENFQKLHGIVIDITARKEIELRQAREHNILRLLIKADSLAGIIKPILQNICETFNWQLGVFWRWDDEQQLLVREELWGKTSTIVKEYLKAIPVGSCSPNSHFLIKNVWQTHESYWLDFSQEKIPGYSNLAEKLDMNSAFAFPVQIKNKLICIFDFFSINKQNVDKESLQSISSISNQIGLFLERMQAQEREKTLNKQLVDIARHAGMAEVAASVLHNIGNVLTSVNVSITLLEEQIQHSKLLNSIAEVNEQLKAHVNDFGRYLTEDPQGKHLPDYLTLFQKALEVERLNATRELNSLTSNIQHIKEVVMRQQVLGGSVLGVVQTALIPEQLEIAISIIGFGPSYIIERHYNVKESVFLDKVKLTQILVNLIRNAKDALLETVQKEKKISVIVHKKADNLIEVQVIDNGTGIVPENITRIFSFGFTTKKKGHGFGLHNSALLAKEMGGTLRVESDGFGKGTTFTLELPYIPASKEINND